MQRQTHRGAQAGESGGSRGRVGRTERASATRSMLWVQGGLCSRYDLVRSALNLDMREGGGVSKVCLAHHPYSNRSEVATLS
jgi:hypothetical protein